MKKNINEKYFSIENLEKVARECGQELQFWRGRPVITTEMAEKLPCPFPPWKEKNEKDT
jgi:hypothetical protein